MADQLFSTFPKQPRSARSNQDLLHTMDPNDFLSFSSSQSRTNKKRTAPYVENTLMLRQRAVNSKLDRLKMQLLAQETKECTGSPQINSNSRHIARKRYKKFQSELQQHMISLSPVAQEMLRYSAYPTNLVAHSPKPGSQMDDSEIFHCSVQLKSGKITSTPLEYGATRSETSIRSSPAQKREIYRGADRFQMKSGMMSVEAFKNSTLSKLKSPDKKRPNFLQMSYDERGKIWSESKISKIKYNQEIKNEAELQECTFAPKIDKNSKKIVKTARRNSNDEKQGAYTRRHLNKKSSRKRVKKGKKVSRRVESSNQEDFDKMMLFSYYTPLSPSFQEVAFREGFDMKSFQEKAKKQERQRKSPTRKSKKPSLSQVVK